RNHMSQNKNSMNPQDTRNLFIFCVISIVMWLGYNHFVVNPQKEATQKARQAQLANQPKIAAPAEVKEITREEALTGTPRINISNDNVFGTITVKGARIDDLGLKNYFETLDKQEHVNILSPKNSPHPRYIEHGWVTTDKNVKLPTAETNWQIQGNSQLTPSSPVTLIWTNGAGLTFTKKFEIDDNNLITVKQTVSNDSTTEITLHPYGLIAQRGLPEVLTRSWLLNEGSIGFIGEDFIEESYKTIRKDGRDEFQADKGWIGITDKYWLTSIIPTQGENTKFSVSYNGTPPAKKQKDKGLYQVDFTGDAITLPPGQNAENISHVIAGAKKVLELEAYGRDLNTPRLDLAVNFGWFWFLSKPFFYALHYLGELVGNFGIAIILFTVLIRMSVFPLTNASFKSFAKMKKVSPQITQLRKEHGEDKQKLQQELMEMYKREGVNPVAGCIPMIIQIPIFFALYKVLFVTIEMRHAPFYGWIKDLSAPDPTSVFNLFGLLPFDPPGFLQIGVWPCLMLTVMVVQRHLNPPPQDPIQRDMAKYFPFIMAFMMAQFAAGLVIYWTFSALISVSQQMFIMWRMDVPIYLFGQSPEEKEMEEQLKDGPAVHPLVEMAEDEVEDALFDEEDEEHKPQPIKDIKPPKPKKKTAKKKKK
ncbi:membrane protein insertase YidC, partial [Alphaproteobacteria bacterium]|nr:membrane protein insertase YidC [Alphaproteobacteria bacterium]